jgi:RNA polymerase sigma-70 factor, ECF subfamily
VSEQEREPRMVVSASAGGGSVTSVSLLQRANVGDQAAWYRLVCLYTPLVSHWCTRRGVPSPDVDDILQEVFQAAARGLTEFQRDRVGAAFRGWLFGIARHKIQQFHRRRNSQPLAAGGSAAAQQILELADSDAGELAAEPADDSPQILKELFRNVLEMIKVEFEARTWSAFWRTVVDGQRAVDVGHELGLSSAAVRMAKCRVLRRAREELGDCVDPM